MSGDPTFLDAYLAGLIDGEGCLCIETNRTPPTRPRYIVRLAIGMAKATELFLTLQKVYGGTLVLRHREGPKYADIDLWRVSARDLRTLLPRVHPFLLLKRPHSEVVQEFLTLSPGSPHPWTPAALSHAEVLRARLSELNRRGKPG